MEIKVRIHETKDCGLHIIDKSEYVSENENNMLLYYVLNKFKYSETYTVTILLKVTASDSTIVDTIISSHIEDEDLVRINITLDGYYILHHIILPSVKWLEKLILDNSLVLANLNIYVTDGVTIYHYLNSLLEEVSSKILSEINTTATTISRKSYDLFSICRIFQCYLNLCKNVFDNTNFRCRDKDDLEDTRFKRDFLWMTINIIKYYVEQGDLLEAQRLLESINYCGGLCKSEDRVDSGSTGCGCNRQSKIESY